MALLAPMRICDAVGAEVPATSFDRLPGERCYLLRPEAPLHLFSQIWSDARFLIFDVAYSAAHHSRLQLRFLARGEAEPRLVAHCGFIPDLTARLAFDFKLLEAQTLFPTRTPGRLKTTILGRRIDPREIARVELLLSDSGRPQWCFISVPRLATEMPFCKVPARVLVDQFGQLAGRTWPGKVLDAADLGSRLQAELTADPSHPRVDRSQYGGCLQRHFESTGWFRIQRESATWWLVDPDGFGFFSIGPCCVRQAEEAAIVPGTEQCYSWLPKKNDPFSDCRGDHAASGTPTVAFGRANLKRAFGDQHRQMWQELTVQRLRRWGFNTVASWSDGEFVRSSAMPWVTTLLRYPSTVVRLYRDLPDVFDPAFAIAAKEYAAQLEELRDDPCLIGYFLNNEPMWAFGGVNLASEMLEGNPGSHSRRALARFVAARYTDDVAAWRRHWGIQADAFDELETRCFHRLADSHPGTASDLWAFSRILARRYGEIPARECRRVDPHHLQLGFRFAWVSSDLCYDATRECDVFSFNGYQLEPDLGAASKASELTGKPVMIGEFHFGALDRGLLGTGLRAVSDQHQRGVAYRRYVEACASSPVLIGCHWFQWNDQPVLGRFDGECWQIGLVDVCQQPYDELIDAARTSHDRLYQLHMGRAKPVTVQATEIPAIAF